MFCEAFGRPAKSFNRLSYSSLYLRCKPMRWSSMLSGVSDKLGLARSAESSRKNWEDNVSVIRSRVQSSEKTYVVYIHMLQFIQSVKGYLEGEVECSRHINVQGWYPGIAETARHIERTNRKSQFRFRFLDERLTHSGKKFWDEGGTWPLIHTCGPKDVSFN